MPGSLVPASDLPEESAPVAANSAVPVSDLPEVPESDLPDDVGSEPAKPSNDLYGGGTQQAIAGLEGAAKGVAGPLATWGEKHILGVPEADIVGRQEANPWTAGIGEAAGFGGSMLTGVGEAALISKAANALTKTAELGKVAQTVIKLGLEGGMFHMGDNASKMILDQTDPEAPVASLLAGVPAAALLGGGLGYLGGKVGNKLQELASNKSANSIPQFMTDLGNRFELMSKHGGDVVGAGTDEAQHLYDTVAGAVEDGFSLKRDSIEKLTKDLDPGTVSSHVNEMQAALEDVPEELRNSAVFKRALGEWQSAVTAERNVVGVPTNIPSAADIFEATDNFKRKLGKLAKFDSPQYGAVDQEMGKAAGNLYHYTRTSLENPEAWGEMGKFQKELNGAYAEMQTPLKAFESSATSKDKDLEKRVDPAKIASIFKSIQKGKPLAGFRDDKVAGFFDPARKFLNTVDSLHAAQGIESEIPKVSTNTLDAMLKKEVSSGAKWGNWLFGSGPGAIGWAGGHVAGTIAGAAATAAGAGPAAPYLGYRAGEHFAPMFKEMGLKPTRVAVSAVLKALSSGEHAGIPQVVNYAEGISKGAGRVENAINNLFTIGGKQQTQAASSEKDREKLREYVENGTLNQQIQDQANKGSGGAPMVTPAPSFAGGGEVLAPQPHMPVSKPVSPLLAGADHIAAVFPQQAMLLGAAKSRINGYLNQIRPQAITSKLPFDDHMDDKAKKKSYDRALDIANNPLSVVDHIKSGTLEPEHVKHMNQLYPELSNHLQKKIMEKVTDAQMKNEKPPYKVRQSLSLFMGQPLDSNLTQQNIAAAQMSFISQKSAPPAGGQNKGSTKGLSDVSNQFRTHDQSIQNRQNRSK